MEYACLAPLHQTVNLAIALTPVNVQVVQLMDISTKLQVNAAIVHNTVFLALDQEIVAIVALVTKLSMELVKKQAIAPNIAIIALHQDSVECATQDLLTLVMAHALLPFLDVLLIII